MSDATLEQRLAKVEEQLSTVIARLDELPKKPSWLDAVGREAGPVDQEFMDILRENREQDRERSIAQMDKKKFFPVKPDKHAWRSTVGMFGDDPILKEIAAEALKYREADRAQARQTAEAEKTP